MEENAITPSSHPNQKQATAEDAYLFRIYGSWSQPASYSAATWRKVVANQPVAVLCRDTLISNILALDWAITPRDSSMLDEVRGAVRHYTNIIERAGYGSDLDYTSHVEWIAGDLLDTPFGGASELGRKNDDPNGRVVWIQPIDADTLFPTGNFDYPIIQVVNTVYAPIPSWAVARTFLNPRPQLDRKGWGIAPPEKIYYILELLSRGDRYYSDLLLDVPPVGILDLGDMEKDAAVEWSKAYRTFLSETGNAPFKIPVLYEHNNDVKFINLGKVPNDIMYDRIIGMYQSIVAAAYGLTLSDIGLQSSSASGETLAGSIRAERKTKRTGFARLKKKLKYYFDQILPSYLQFSFIDYDDELQVALGRARLANATAFNLYKQMGAFSTKELRVQAIRDGLFDASFPEEPPVDAVEVENPRKPAERPGMLGLPVPPSQGGEGEIVRSSVFSSTLDAVVEDTRSLFSAYADAIGEDNLFSLSDSVEKSMFGTDTVGINQCLHHVNLFVMDNDDVNKTLSELVQKSWILSAYRIFSSEGFDNLDVDSVRFRIESETDYSELLALAKQKGENNGR